MNRNIIALFAIFYIAFISGNPLLSQSFFRYSQHDSEYGLTISEWDRVNERWSKFQPRITVVTLAGDTIMGQLISASSEGITVFQGDSLPFSDIIEGKTEEINVDDIHEIIFTKGGDHSIAVVSGVIVGGGIGLIAGILLAQGWSIIPPIVLGTGLATGGAFLFKAIDNNGRTLMLNADDTPTKKRRYLGKLAENAVLTDGYVADGSFNQFAKMSRSVRKAFPDKHFRISTGISKGPIFFEKGIDKMILAASMPPVVSYSMIPYIDLVDLSWRFSDRFIAGGQVLITTDNPGEFRNYSSDSIKYYGSILNSEQRLYFEYSPWPVTRAFAKKFELLLGTGVVFTESGFSIYYAYRPEYSVQDIWIDRSYYASLMGLHLRSALHYYFMPGFSVSAGVEGNIMQRLQIESFQLPSSVPSEQFTIPDSRINFSNFRFKAGVNIYF